jgi:hypothetical protein
VFSFFAWVLIVLRFSQLQEHERSRGLPTGTSPPKPPFAAHADTAHALHAQQAAQQAHAAAHAYAPAAAAFAGASAGGGGAHPPPPPRTLDELTWEQLLPHAAATFQQTSKRAGLPQPPPQPAPIDPRDQPAPPLYVRAVTDSLTTFQIQMKNTFRFPFRMRGTRQSLLGLIPTLPLLYTARAHLPS